MKTKSLKINLIMNYIKTIVGILFPLITFPYASRILLTQGIGRVNFVASVIVYLQLIASLGISTYAIREGAKLREDKPGLSQFCSEMLLINFISMAVAYGILGILLWIPRFKEYQSSLLIYGLVIFFGVLGVDWLYSILEDFTYITVRAVVFQFLSLILLFIFVRHQDDVNRYILVTVLSTAGSSVLNLVHSRRYVCWFKGKEKYHLKRHIRPIFIIFGTTLATKVYLNMDTIMIGIMKTDHEVGLYSAAIKMNMVLSAIITAISGVMLPRLSLYIGQNKDKEFRQLVKRSMDYLIFATVPVIAGLFCIAKNVIVLFSGEAFAPAFVTMRILLPNLFCSILNGFMAYQVLIPNKKEKWTLYATLAGAVTNFILNFFLIPFLAQNGAAIATVITECVVFCVCFHYCKNVVDIKEIFRGIWQYFIASGIFVIVYLAIKKMGMKSDILIIIVEVIAGACGYILLLLLMGNPFLKNIFSMFSKKKGGE